MHTHTWHIYNVGKCFHAGFHGLTKMLRRSAACSGLLVRASAGPNLCRNALVPAVIHSTYPCGISNKDISTCARPVLLLQ